MKNIKNIQWILYVTIAIVIGVAYLNPNIKLADSDPELNMFNAFVTYPEIRRSESVNAKIIQVKEFKACTMLTDVDSNKFSICAYEFEKHSMHLRKSIFEFIEINDSIGRVSYCDTIYLFKVNGEILLFEGLFNLD